MPRQDADGFEYWHAKSRDPYVFKAADDFFSELHGAGAETRQPTSVSLHDEDQKVKGADNPATKSYGKIFRFDDGTCMLIQFMRPRVWRIRYHPRFAAQDYSDFNTRTIVQDTLTDLIRVLDIAEGLDWHVECKTIDSRWYLLQSVVNKTVSDPDVNSEVVGRDICVQLWIQRNPFRITAVRSIEAAGTPTLLPALQHPQLEFDLKDAMPAEAGHNTAIIWQTKERGLLYQGDASILNVDKPQTAKYLGFGEQGGHSLYKDKTFMNYFNFDNMRYFNVYGNGPLEDAEPLYHSEPYWIEVNAHPGYMSQVATFIDNYSHVAVDLGKTDHNRTAIATRFNSFQGIFMAGDDLGEVIRLYTSLIGRPWLRPRYVLGNHQGCYGYETQDLVEYNAAQFKKWGIPLDGMHIDVDMQRDYRTFTIDTRPGKFPDPQGMFKRLRSQGVKCSTNITPVIAIREDPEFVYETLESGWKGSGKTGDRYQDNYFVRDIRDNDPSLHPQEDERYLQYGMGTRYYTQPSQRPEYGDNYDFPANRNSGWPFHGGVDYGGTKGSPGFYPNLNRYAVRKWWGEQYKYLFDMGLDFVWQDMTSPCMAQQYGDMKSWPFRLMLDSNGWPKDPIASAQKRAIEIWSLYSFNLHKATFKGLGALDTRNDKRNFIIGRGSFAGAQRFAGLWTGDNSSTWEFFEISVAQVLALGLAGVAISGADVGGFEPPTDWERFADPELLVRWYGAYSLLPWFRNHYVRKGKKWFQEPFEYENYRNDPNNNIPDGDKDLYRAVLPVCRYLIRLRYSLMQLLYDAMFENLINGLPIARAMCITDPLDASLFSSNEWYTAHQYMVRHDLLVAPVLYQKSRRATRKVYLPAADGWYQFNLRPDSDPSSPGSKLTERIRGGSYIEYDARIDYRDEQLPYATPMFVREGGIIPQIEVRQSVPDRTRSKEFPELAAEPANPITFHIYPGRDNKYRMYLDDGVSRKSAPSPIWLSVNEVAQDSDVGKTLIDAYGDGDAENAFREVIVTQQTVRKIDDDTGNWNDVRTIKISTSLGSGYTDAEVEQSAGTEYRVAVWHPINIDIDTVEVVTTDNCSKTYKPWTNKDSRVTLLRVPTGEKINAVIEVQNAV